MPRKPFEIAAYFPEWEVRRPYYVKNIVEVGAAERITLINYAFGFPAPDPEGAVVCQFRDPYAAYAQQYTPEMSVDGVGDAPDQALRGHFHQLRKLKGLFPNIRIVISLGGWTESTWFSDAARTRESRRIFVASCIDRYIHGNLPVLDGAGGKGAGEGVFDGIDLDWEYPIGGGLPNMHNNPEDDKNFVLLLEEFRRQYEAIRRPDLMLTAAVPGPAQAGQFEMGLAHSLLDYAAIMTYDLRGDDNRVTGHHTNLYNSTSDPAPEPDKISADATIRLYQSYGVPAEKLLIGAAFYGRGWRGVPSDRHGLYQPGLPLGEGGGNYYRLLEHMKAGYDRYWDESAMAPYLYNETEGIWISYDDVRSVGLKAAYVRYHGLGGVMFWEITGDDARGSLVNTIHEQLTSVLPVVDPRET